MQETISSTTPRVAPLTPDDRKPPEQGRGLRPPKAKSVAAARINASTSLEKDLADLAVPDSQEKHQLDELA
jgi:hypothetical protein